MTLTTLTSRVSYPGAGSTGPFAYPFRIIQNADLVVTKRSSTGVETILTLTTDYTVAGALETTGTITLVTALAAGETLVIRRSPALTQMTSIRNQGEYFPATIEDEFDRLAMQIQALQDQLSRSPKLMETYGPATYNLAAVKPVANQVLSWDATGTKIESRSVSDSATTLPGAGRTVGTLSSYLANNAVFNIMDYGAVIGTGVDSSTAIQATIDAAGTNGGGNVVVPPYTFKAQDLTFKSWSSVLIVGLSQNYGYQYSKTASVFSVTTGIWGIRLPATSKDCGILNIGLVSNGQLNAAAPHAVITAGVEYGVLIEIGATLLEAVTVYGFQYGCVLANGGNQNVFDRCNFLWNTKCGFACMPSSANAYAAYHPNLVAPAASTKTTVYTMRSCNIRINGWGMILREGDGSFFNLVVESNYFGGLIEYLGTLDTEGPYGTWYNCYFENNWAAYDKDAAYTVTQNKFLQETLGVWIPFTLNTNTALSDAGYQIFVSGVGTGTTAGPGYQNFYKLTLNLFTGVTQQKGVYLRQSYKFKFHYGSCTGGDQTNAVRLESGGGGHYGNQTHFYDWNGTLPATLGNRGFSVEAEGDSTYGGGLTALVGYFKGLFGNVQFPATQVASADANMLDDYEEGDWTPTLGGDGADTGQTYTTQKGSYTKIGRLVTVTFEVKLLVKGTLGGTLAAVKGLPFTSASGKAPASAAIGYAVTFASNVQDVSGYVVANDTMLLLTGSTVLGVNPRDNLVKAVIANTTYIMGSASYYV